MQFKKVYLLILITSILSSPLISMESPEKERRNSTIQPPAAAAGYLNPEQCIQEHNDTTCSQNQSPTSPEINRLLLNITLATNSIATSLEKLTEPKSDDRPIYHSSQIPDITKELQDALIAGCPKKLHELLNNIEFAQRSTTAPEIKQQLLSNIPNLILFVGPPGVGKTSMGIAIANHLGWRLAFKEAGALCNKYKNSGIEGIDNLFKDALTTNHPYVIILDELKSLTDKHNNKGDFDANVVEYLWQTFDKCIGKRIFVIATTNDASKVPGALKSRFSRDFTFNIELPNDELRLITFTVCLPKTITSENIEISHTVNDTQKKKLVRKTKKFSQRDIVGIVKKAQKAAEARAVETCKKNTSAKFTVIVCFADLENEINAQLPGWRELWGWNTTISKSLPYIMQLIRVGLTGWNIYMQITSQDNQVKSLNYQKQSFEQQQMSLGLSLNQQIDNKEKEQITRFFEVFGRMVKENKYQVTYSDGKNSYEYANADFAIKWFLYGTNEHISDPNETFSKNSYKYTISAAGEKQLQDYATEALKIVDQRKEGSVFRREPLRNSAAAAINDDVKSALFLTQKSSEYDED